MSSGLPLPLGTGSVSQVPLPPRGELLEGSDRSMTDTAGSTDATRSSAPFEVTTTGEFAAILAALGKTLAVASYNSGLLLLASAAPSGLVLLSRAFDKPMSLASREGRLVRFGLLLGLAGTGWVLTSAGLITLASPTPIEKPLDFLRFVVLAPQPGLFELWLLQGALLATPVYASTVVALPMLVDRPVPVHQAVMASWRAVAAHPGPMVLWALLIAVLVGLGMVLALAGLVVVIPWIAHASWHAYRDLAAH